MRLLSLSAFRKSLRPTNWLLRASGMKIWIKYRSFLNDHLPPEDPQIIELERDDIAWVCPVKITIRTRRNDGTDTFLWLKCLDIGLNRLDHREIQKLLLDERDRPCGGTGWIKSKSANHPVMSPQEGVLRLIWSDQFGRIQPGVGKAVEFFNRFTRIKPELKLVLDGRPKALANLSQQDLSQRLRDLQQFALPSPTPAPSPSPLQSEI
jgi:hypothetical protein